MAPRYGCGDKVFAKVRGYPPWPARVDCIADSSPSNIKYHVFFYGTLERGVCRNQDLYPYQENKEKLSKPNKRKDFQRAINQIEGIEPVPQLVPIVEGKLINGLPKEPTNNSKKQLIKNGTGNINEMKKPSRSRKAHVPVTDENGTSFNNNVNTIEESKTKKCSPKNRCIVLDKICSPDGIGKIPEENIELPQPISVTTECSEPNSYQLSAPEILSRSGRKIKKKVFADEIESPPPKKRKQEVLSHQNLTTVSSQKKKIPNAVNNLSPLRKEVIRTSDNGILDIDSSYANKQSALEWLTTENCMTRLDTLIRSHLGMSKANPKQCLDSLDNMSNLKLKPLMLKKHPEVVETIKRLRKYVGNASAWNFSVEQQREFDEQAQEIRAKAEFIFDKFKKMFSASDNTSFLELFADSVLAFQKKTEDWPLAKIYSLTTEPKMRKSPDKTRSLQLTKMSVNGNDHNSSDSDQVTPIQSDVTCEEMSTKDNETPPSPRKKPVTKPKRQIKKVTARKEKECPKESNQVNKRVRQTRAKKIN